MYMYLPLCTLYEVYAKTLTLKLSAPVLFGFFLLVLI